MAQQIVVAGESLVVEFVDGANLYMYEHIAAETRLAAGRLWGKLEDAQSRSVTSSTEGEHGMPMAWLLEINVGAGHIASVIAQFQRAMAQHRGLDFVRVVQGSLRTDAEVAAEILKAKHSPKILEVTLDSGFAPAPDPWLVWMQNMAR